MRITITFVFFCLWAVTYYWAFEMVVFGDHNDVTDFMIQLMWIAITSTFAVLLIWFLKEEHSGETANARYR